MDSIGKLEAAKGRPVYFVEIYQDIVQTASTADMRNSVENLYNLFKDDKVLCDAEMNLFSLNCEL